MFNLTRQEQVVIVALVAVTVVGLGVRYYKREAARRGSFQIVEKSEEKNRRSEKKVAKKILVDVGGAVWSPGVYEMEAGSRMEDVLKKAQPLKNANLLPLNRAAFLRDGDKIVVPYLSSQKSSKTGDSPQNEVSVVKEEKVNINTATKEELMKLPSVGPVRAQAIIDYRNKHGNFRSINDIKEIEGIGEKTFNKFKDKITLY